VSIIDPAADHVKEVHGDREVEALFPPPDEEPQTQGTARTIRQFNALVLNICFVSDKMKCCEYSRVKNNSCDIINGKYSV